MLQISYQAFYVFVDVAYFKTDPHYVAQARFAAGTQDRPHHAQL